MAFTWFGQSKTKEIDELTGRIRKFKPPPSFAELNNKSAVLSIGFFGNLAVGKSSLINSLLSIISTDEYHAKAHVCPLDPAIWGSKRQGTIVRNDFQLTPFIKLVDNRGLGGATSKEIQSEILAQLGITKTCLFTFITVLVVII